MVNVSRRYVFHSANMTLCAAIEADRFGHFVAMFYGLNSGAQRSRNFGVIVDPATGHTRARAKLHCTRTYKPHELELAKEEAMRFCGISA